MNPQDCLEGLWGQGDDQSVSSRLPGAAIPRAPTHPSIHPSKGTTKGTSLNLSGRFCRHGSEQGSFPGHQSHMVISLDNAGRVISASRPCCIPLHPCQRLGKAWNSVIPILFSPPRCTHRSPSGPSDPRPRPKDSDIDIPCSFVFPSALGSYLMLGNRSWGRQEVAASTAGEFLCHRCTPSPEQHDLDEFPCVPSILCSAGKFSIKPSSSSLPAHHLLPPRSPALLSPALLRSQLNSSHEVPLPCLRSFPPLLPGHSR